MKHYRASIERFFDFVLSMDKTRSCLCSNFLCGYLHKPGVKPDVSQTISRVWYSLHQRSILLDQDLEIRSSILYVHFWILILHVVVTQLDTFRKYNSDEHRSYIKVFRQSDNDSTCRAIAEISALSKIVVKVKSLVFKSMLLDYNEDN